jgi:hypothetical protein
VSIAPALRALLEHAVDYAGLFPPASLSIQAAATEYAAHRESPMAWMLGRFVVPVARLDELATAATLSGAAQGAEHGAEQGAWPLSVLVSADPAGDAEVMRTFGAKHHGRFEIESVELRAASPEAIEWALSLLDRTLERYVEIPLDVDLDPLLRTIGRHGGRAKARTGGVTPESFPSSAALARFIAACARVDVPFKATAGLHHPLRGEHPLTYENNATAATMFGFIDVFAAAALARSGVDEATLVRVLDERDPGAFSFSDDELRWRDHSVGVAQLAASRHDLAISFGSCSFREPVDDLHRLRLL